MTKTELISAMAAECGLSKTDAGKALDAFMHQATVAPVSYTHLGSSPSTMTNTRNSVMMRLVKLVVCMLS